MRRRPNIRLVSKALGFVALAAVWSLPAAAADAEYYFTQEFLDVCNGSQLSYNGGKKQFTDSEWIETSSEMKEAMDPAFYLNAVSAYKAYQRDVPDLGTWYGTMSKGKLQNFKVRMCNLWLISDDIEGVRADFENVIGQTPSDQTKVEGEDRFIYFPDGATQFHFAQEADAGDGAYVIILSKVFAGK